MRVTSKGQVTIPQAIRERYGLLPETEVEFVAKGKDVLIRRRAGVPVHPGIARLRGSGSGRMTTDQILALTRKS